MKKTGIRIAALLLAVLLAGCGSNTETKGEQLADDEGDYVLEQSAAMDEATRTEIDAVRGAFEKALAARNAAGIMDHVAADFGATQGSITSFLESAGKEGMSAYTRYDSYYFKDLTVSDTMIRAKKAPEDENYISFTPGSTEMDITLYQSDNAEVSQMIALICAKRDNAWEIVWIDTSDSRYYGKDAPAIYQLAQDAKNNGQDVLAYVYAQMLYNIYHPANALYYKDDTAMLDLVMERNSWGSKRFPIALADGVSKIHTIGIAREEGGVVPMVFVQTSAEIKDAASRQKLAESVRDEFLKNNAGIADAFAHITVRMTNEDVAKATAQVKYESVVVPTK